MPGNWGIDGCKAGWLAVSLNLPGYRLVQSQADLAGLIDEAHAVWIDIPIGLTENSVRLCDRQLRTAMKRRAASVFLTPVRPAVFADNYRQACQINEEHTGRRISKQVRNIVPKIKQVDEVLREKPERVAKVYESHPEYLFMMLNDGIPLPSKKSEEGRMIRQILLYDLDPGISRLQDQILESYTRQNVRGDDIIDAMVLACASAAKEQIATFPLNPPVDSKNLPMAIHYIKEDYSRIRS